MKRLLLLIFAAAFFPRAQAVVPAPDGGYPVGNNTAEGRYRRSFSPLSTHGRLQHGRGIWRPVFTIPPASQNTATGVNALR